MAPACHLPELTSTLALRRSAPPVQSGFKKKEKDLEAELSSLRAAVGAAQQAAAEEAQRAGQAQQEAQAAQQDR